MASDIVVDVDSTSIKERKKNGVNGDFVRGDVDHPEKAKSDLLYGIEDTPPWYLIVFLGFQQYLTMFGSTVAVPLIVTPAMCIGNDYVGQSEIIGTIFFVSGLITLLQSTLGVRLPVVQGATFAFLAPTFAILGLPKWSCENVGVIDTNTTSQSDIWQPRMREIQGAVVIASLFQVAVGFTGLLGLLLRFIGPITIASTISLVGLALFDVAADFSGNHWWIALLTVAAITLFSQYLRDVNIPCCSYSSKGGCGVTGYKMFKMFPVVLGIAVSWILCYVLTRTDVFPDDPSKWGYTARTDTKIDVLTESKWFRFPYPGQWGTPTISTSAVFGMLSGVLASMIESLGDYYAAARLSGAPPPPVHAINRGIFIEGIGCILAGIWGTGNGTTSYSENVGAIGITKVASRRVVQTGAILMVLFGMFGKFGAFFVTIPDPIIGGIFLVMFGTVFAVGVSNLQFVDLNSGRNIYIYGFSVIFGLGLPKWMGANPGVIDTGNDSGDQILTVLCSTSMFVGGVMAAILDNTIPGTPEERGMITWNSHHTQQSPEDDDNSSGVYEFPCCMRKVRSSSWTRFVPICPTFRGWFTSKKDDDVTEQSANKDRY